MLDPASATVAFVGFTASIITVAALAVDSSRTLYDLRAKLKNAPADVRALIDTFSILENLLQELRRCANEYDSSTIPTELIQLWKSLIPQLEKDLKSWKGVVDNFTGCQNNTSGLSSKRSIRKRIRQVFSEKLVKDYHDLVSKHIETFTLVQSLIANSQNGLTSRKLQEHTQHLEILVQGSIVAQGDLATTKSLMQAVHPMVMGWDERNERINTRLQSHTRVLDAIQAEQVATRTATEAVHAEVVGADTLHNEGFGALRRAIENYQDTTGTALRKGQEENAILLGKIDGKLQHMIQNRLLSCNRSTYRNSVVKPQSQQPNIKVARRQVLWRYHRITLPIGALTVDMSSESIDDNEDVDARAAYKIRFQFEPPWWISNKWIMFSLGMKIGSYMGISRLDWDMCCIRINQNGRLRACVYNLDVPGLQKLFAANIARPTDLVPSNLVGWHDNLLLAAMKGFLWRARFLPSASSTRLFLAFCDFLFQQGLRIRLNQAYNWKFLDAPSDIKYIEDEDLESSLVLKVYQNENFEFQAASSLILSSMDWRKNIFLYHQYLLGHLSRWRDELDVEVKGLIAAHAYTYEGFRIKLHQVLDEIGTVSIEDFDLSKIVLQLRECANPKVKWVFGCVCCFGTAKMVLPFITTGNQNYCADILDDCPFDFSRPFDRTYRYDSSFRDQQYLGLAARCGNADTFDCLYDYGATNRKSEIIYLGFENYEHGLSHEKRHSVLEHLVPRLIQRSDPEKNRGLLGSFCRESLHYSFQSDSTRKLLIESGYFIAAKKLDAGVSLCAEIWEIMNIRSMDREVSQLVTELIKFETNPDRVLYLKMAVLSRTLNAVKSLVAQGADPEQREHRIVFPLNLYYLPRLSWHRFNLAFSAFEISSQLMAPGLLSHRQGNSPIDCQNDRAINDFLVEAVQKRRQSNNIGSNSNIEQFLTDRSPYYSRVVQSLLHPVKKLHSYAVWHYAWYRQLYHTMSYFSFIHGLGYIFSYTILIVLEVGDLLIWLVNVPRPPAFGTTRSLMIVLAFLWLYGKISSTPA